MGKILGSWSGMRKYLETEMLAVCLRGRVRYGCTAYVGMDGCRFFEVCVDGEQYKRFSLETVNTYFINHGYKAKSDPVGTREYWEEFWPLLDKTPQTAGLNIRTTSSAMHLRHTAIILFRRVFVRKIR